MPLIGTELARNKAQNPSGRSVAVGSVLLRRNLADNPGVETDGVGYFVISGTSGVATTVKSSIGALAYHGAAYARTAWTTATTAVGGGVEYRNRSGGGVPVVAGSPYAVGWFALSSKAQRMQLQLEWRNAASGVISTSLGDAVVVPAAQWGRLQAVATAPAGAVTLRVRLVAVAGTGGVNWANGDYVAVDSLLVEQTTRLLDYFDSTIRYYGTPSVAGDGSIELYDDVATVRTNLCQNPSAEVDTSYAMARGSGSVLITDTTRAVYGLRSFKVAAGTAGTARSYLWQAFLDSAAPGEIFTFSAYVWSPSARNLAGVYEAIDLAGGVTSNFSGVAALTAGQWTRVSFPFAVPPVASSAIKSLNLGFWSDNGPASESLWVDGVLIERGWPLDDFFDGSSGPVGQELNVWAVPPSGANPGRTFSRRVAPIPDGWTPQLGAAVYQHATGGVGVVGTYTQTSAAGSGVLCRAPSLVVGESFTLVAKVRAVDACTLQLNGAAQVTLAAGGTAELRGSAVSANVGGLPKVTLTVLQLDAAPKRWVVDGWAAVPDPAYTGPFFDGATSPVSSDSRYVWVGVADNSDSVWEYLPSPDLTAVVDLDFKGVTLVAEGIATVARISIRRVVDGYEPALARAARAALTVGGQLFAFDIEAPLGLPITYQAKAHYTDGSTSGWSDSIVVTIPVAENEVWLKDVGQPLRSLRVILREASERRRQARTELHDIQDAPLPLAVSSVRSAGTEEVVFGTTTESERSRFDTILDSGQPLLMQTPPGWGRKDAFVNVGDSRERRVKQHGPHPYRNWSVTLTEVSEPGSDRTGLPANSYSIVLGGFASYAAVMENRPTYLSVLAGSAAVQ